MKLEVLNYCKICENKIINKPVRRYIDDVGRTVTAHACCVKAENKIEKCKKMLTDAEWEMFYLKREYDFSYSFKKGM
jgi:hypothetical protein